MVLLSTIAVVVGVGFSHRQRADHAGSRFEDGRFLLLAFVDERGRGNSVLKFEKYSLNAYVCRRRVPQRTTEKSIARPPSLALATFKCLHSSLSCSFGDYSNHLISQWMIALHTTHSNQYSIVYRAPGCVWMQIFSVRRSAHMYVCKAIDRRAPN